MKLTWILAGSFLVGIFFSSCAENHSNDTAGDSIHSSITDTIGVPTQGYGPDMSTIHVLDTIPDKDTVK